MVTTNNLTLIILEGGIKSILFKVDSIIINKLKKIQSYDKKILSLSALFLIINTYAQLNVFIIPETWEVDSWNGADWSNFSKTTYSFNGSCFITQVLSQARSIDTGELENAVLLTLTNNLNNLQIEGVNQLWNGSSWDNYQKFEHTYNGNDDVIETKNYNWEVGNWELDYRDVYTYGSPGFPSKITEQEWDDVNNIWLDKTESSYTYTGFW